MNRNNFNDNISKLSTIPQAMERYKISRSTLMKYAADNNAIIRFGRSVRIDCEKMDAYIEQAAGNEGRE